MHRYHGFHGRGLQAGSLLGLLLSALLAVGCKVQPGVDSSPPPMIDYATMMARAKVVQHKASYEYKFRRAWNDSGTVQATRYVKPPRLRYDSTLMVAVAGFSYSEAKYILPDGNYVCRLSMNPVICETMFAIPPDVTWPTEWANQPATEKGTRQLLGMTAYCYGIEERTFLNDIRQVERCYTVDGVMLSSRHLIGDMDSEAVATSYTLSVSDDEFLLPAPVK